MTEPQSIVWDPKDAPAVKAIGGEISQVMEVARSLDVAAEGGLEWSAAVLGELKKIRDRIEEKRREFVGPLNTHIRFINGFFKGMDQPVAEVDQQLRGRLLKHRQQLEAERRTAELRVREAVDEKQRQALVSDAAEAVEVFGEDELERHAKELRRKAESQPKTVSTPMGTTTVRKVWDFEVTASERVPHVYLRIDPELVRAAIRGGARDIAGLRIFEREVLAVKTGR